MNENWSEEMLGVILEKASDRMKRTAQQAGEQPSGGGDVRRVSSGKLLGVMGVRVEKKKRGKSNANQSR